MNNSKLNIQNTSLPKSKILVTDVFNNGDMLRDFTYIDDIVEGITRVIDNPPSQSTINNQPHLTRCTI